MDSYEVFEIVKWVGIVLIFGGVAYWIFFGREKGFSFGKAREGSIQNLESFALNLTEKAKDGKVDPVIGRQEEILRVTQILTRRNKNNVILTGPSGVGKTAIVEGLALGIATGDVPPVLRNKKILSLRVSELLAGTKYRGEFEQRVKKIIEEIRKSNRTIILFIDELHTVMETKGTEGAVNFSDILKPALARGDLQLIGATTKKEYEQYIKPDESVDRRFQVVAIDEPSIEETVKILHGVKKNYETYHKVRFTDKAIEAAARFSEEYIESRRLPDKAIDVIDEAAAMVNVQGEGVKDHAVALLHGAAGGVGKEKSGSNKVAEKEDLESGSKDEWPEITVEHVKEIVAEWVGMKAEEIH